MDDKAVAERLKEQTEAIQRLTMNDDLEKTANERMNLFYNFLKVMGFYWILKKSSVLTEEVLVKASFVLLLFWYDLQF